MTYKIKVIRLDFKICKQGLVKSYEIKLPPRAILGFKILDIFSIENSDSLGVMM